MARRLFPAWSRFGSDGPGLFSGTVLTLALLLGVNLGGIQASLTLGPEGRFPRLRDVLLYALSHDDGRSLAVSVCCLLLVAPRQERRWGTVAFLGLSLVSMALVPFAYSLVLWVGAGEASRVCGYSAVQLALFTAQCRQVRGRRLLRCVPHWLLPWGALLLFLLLLPGSPALLHFCAICIGHNYGASFIGTVQELERVMGHVPEWAYVSAPPRLRLPSHAPPRHRSCAETLHREEPGPSVNPGTGPGTESGRGAGPGRGPGAAPAPGAGFGWDGSCGSSEAELLEEQLLHAGIMASLRETADCSRPGAGPLCSGRDVLLRPEAKVELPKSSVSSLRLQQLQRMGFPTEKAVVALAASKQLEGAVSLLIDDGIGSEAVVVGAKSPGPPPLR